MRDYTIDDIMNSKIEHPLGGYQSVLEVGRYEVSVVGGRKTNHGDFINTFETKKYISIGVRYNNSWRVNSNNTLNQIDSLVNTLNKYFLNMDIVILSDKEGYDQNTPLHAAIFRSTQIQQIIYLKISK